MKIAIFDYDNTLSSGYTRYELAYAMEKAGAISKGIKQEIEDLESKYFSGEIDYNEKFAEDKKIFSRYYDGVKRIDTVRFLREEFNLASYIFPWAKELIEQLKSRGYLTVLISGSWDFILEDVQEILEFDAFFGSEFEIVNGKFTKEYKRIMTTEQKRIVTKELLEDSESSIGVGDSPADFAILELVNHPFLYEPSKDSIDAIGDLPIKILNEKTVLSEILKVAQ